MMPDGQLVFDAVIDSAHQSTSDAHHTSDDHLDGFERYT